MAGVADPAPAKPKSSSNAIVSLCVGLLAAVISACDLSAARQLQHSASDMGATPNMVLFAPLAILGIVIGVSALVDIRRSRAGPAGRGKAVAGIALSALALAALPFLGQLAKIGPSHRVNERLAVSALRTIAVAETTYRDTYPKVGFSPDLKSLGGEPPCQPVPEHSCLINQELATGAKSRDRLSSAGSGYRFTYTAADTDHDGVLDAFAVQADPPADVPARHFFVDQTEVIRIESGHPATASSPPLQ